MYIPRRGDFIWIDFDPQAGHEQMGNRPALVVSHDVGQTHENLRSLQLEDFSFHAFLLTKSKSLTG